MSLDRLQGELRRVLGDVRRRWTSVVRRRAFARAAAGATIAIVAAAVLERVLHPEGMRLVLLMAAAPLLAAMVVVMAIRRMPRRPSDHRVARFIEERTTLNDSLVSAVDAMARPAAAQPVFLSVLLDDALQKVRELDLSTVVTLEETRRYTIGAAAAAAVLLGALIVTWPSFDRAAATARFRLFPGSVAIQVQPGNARVPTGTSLKIRASVRGTSGSLTQLPPTLMVFANGQQRAVQMTAASDVFTYVFESVDRSFSYDVSLGAVRSARYAVTALRPPRVERIDVHYDYPSFAKLPPRDEHDGGDIYAPAGTRVHLRIQTDKPIAAGALALSRSPAVSLRRQDDCTVEAELQLGKDDSYRIHLTDEDGLMSRGEAEYFIRLMDDRPPDVRILRPSADQQITPLEEVAIEARADDDYGIERFELVYGVAGRAEHTVPFERVTGTSIQKIGTRLLPAEELGVRPGDVITYYARARDVGRGKRATEATSDIYFLEVKPFNEEFTAAESQAGAGASDPQIESLIQAQKEIIASTWNVERRAQAARSTDDVKAIAAAQAELKARAEKQLMTRTMRGRTRTPAPEQRIALPDQSRASADDPASSALGAMGKALDQLALEKTKEALPHEMSALNGLLQLQAEVRRRQVAQGAGAGNAWGNRVGQDLSALFDKELQRQQRTNYETRAAAEIKPDSADSQTSALDRIRELAKRQEDLNRRQRDLAASNLSADEMKRQLEKLTREQIELREQTEELMRRNAQRDASNQTRSTRQSPSDGSGQGQSAGELRDAADQMRSAASDLRRENPLDAARNGERAADQLRRLERHMQGDVQGGNARAEGDLKLEAQQIAQEQHRIATEAGRLGRNNSATVVADARKRLADEKDKLASRVDDLAKAADQISRDAAVPDAKTLENSARTLQRDKIADRMRGGARQLRDSQSAIPAASEEELARALDQVARGLGATDSGLSSQLDQTRAIRDGLQRAEQQLRDAETRARGSKDGGPSAGQPSRGMNGRQGSTGSGDAAREVQRLRDEYQRELQRAEDALRRLNGGAATGSLGGATPEQHEFSRSAPGTEAFKQDRSEWESLRKNLDTELEKYEASLSDRLSHSKSDERFSAGGSDRVPDAYSQLIARYFESLAKKKK